MLFNVVNPLAFDPYALAVKSVTAGVPTGYTVTIWLAALAMLPLRAIADTVACPGPIAV
ncbi:hypothetical protein D3C86_2254760 [compost metagenome]